jgi:hypothetical protein
MCISETWLSNQNQNAIKQQLRNNYTTLSSERDTKNGGGTILLINKEYTTQHPAHHNKKDRKHRSRNKSSKDQTKQAHRLAT